MFEAQVAYYLNKYLGEYVAGLDAESLKITVWKGDVELRNLQLKTEALQGLNLPVTVRSGLLGKLKLKVPWAQLGRQPVILELDRLYLLASPKVDDQGGAYQSVEDYELSTQVTESREKREGIDRAENEWIKEREAKLKEKGPQEQDAKGSQPGRFRSFIDTVVGNLQVKITNIHIMYQDDVSQPGHVFSLGVLLGGIAAHTVDVNGKETFVSTNALNILRKRVVLNDLSTYFDTDCQQVRPPRRWSQMTVEEWDQLFLVQNHNKEGSHQFLLQPVLGDLLYVRRGASSRPSVEDAQQEFDLHLEDIRVGFTHLQYQTLRLLLGVWDRYQASLPHRQWRPTCRPTAGVGARVWWRYAFKAVCSQGNTFTLSWKQLKAVAQVRKKYIPLYAELLESGVVGGNPETFAMEEQLDEKTVLMFRRMAHVKYELKLKSQLAAGMPKAPASQEGGGGWFGWLTGGHRNREDAHAAPDGDVTPEMNPQMGPDEWRKLEELVEEQEALEEDTKETPHTVRARYHLLVGSGALELIGQKGSRQLLASMNDVAAQVVQYPVTLGLKITVHSFGAETSGGPLMTSGINAKSDTGTPPLDSTALYVVYTLRPQEQDVDARVEMRVAPSYVTYDAAALTGIMDFFKSDEALELSRLQARASAQYDQLTRMAQLQLESLSKAQNRARLSASIEIHAPKVAILDTLSSTTLVVDLGRFNLDSNRTLRDSLSPEEAAVYECFSLKVDYLLAYFLEGPFAWPQAAPADDGQEALTGPGIWGPERQVVTLMERFGIETDVQAAVTGHPRYPMFRLAMDTSPLKVHLSPYRYQHLMMMLRSLTPPATPGEAGKQDAAGGRQGGDTKEAAPQWKSSSEYQTKVALLQWEGMAGTVATWHSRWLYVWQGRLYLCRHSGDVAPLVVKAFWRDCRIIFLPPDAVGGAEHVLAICAKDVKKDFVAEDPHSLVIQASDNLAAGELRQVLTRSMNQMNAVAGMLQLDLSSEALNDGDSEPTDLFGDLLKHRPILQLSCTISEISLELQGRPPRDGWELDGNPKVGGAHKLAGLSGPLKAVEEFHQFASDGVTVRHILDLVHLQDEQPLLTLRLSGAHVGLSHSLDMLRFDVVMTSLEMEDQLMGAGNAAQHYMARSWVQDVKGSSGKDVQQGSPMEYPGEGTGSGSRTTSLAARSTSFPGSGAPPPFPGDVSTLMSIAFTWHNPKSDQYQGVDSEVAVKLDKLLFFCNRPTVAALMRFGLDLGDINRVLAGDVPPDSSQMVDQASESSSQSGSVEDVVRGGGAQRTIFKMNLQVGQVSLHVQYEGSAQQCLAIGALDSFSLSLALHPTTLVLNTSLGNLEAVYGALPPDHPHRVICTMRPGTQESLIEVDFRIHDIQESFREARVPSGGPYYSCSARLSAVQLVYLQRFLMEFLEYINVMLALQASPQLEPLPVPGSDTQEGEDSSTTPRTPQAPSPLSTDLVAFSGQRGLADSTVDNTEGQAAAPSGPEQPSSGPSPPAPLVLLLDVSLAAPIITLPMTSQKVDAIEVDLGYLKVENLVRWDDPLGRGQPGGGESKGAVLLDIMQVCLSKMSCVVIRDGKRGDNVIREMGEGFQVSVQRPLSPLGPSTPPIQVSVQVPNLKACLVDIDYHLILMILSSNFAEQPSFPPEVAELHRRFIRNTEATSSTTAELPRQASPTLNFPKARTEQAKRIQKKWVSNFDVSPAQIWGVLSDQCFVKVSVLLSYAQLELLTLVQELGEVQPLGALELRDLWLSHQGTTKGNMCVQVHLPTVTVRDQRPGVPSHQSLVVSTSHRGGVNTLDADKQVPSDGAPPAALANPSLLVLEYRMVRSQAYPMQALRLRLQQPTIVLDVGFVISAIQFAVPTPVLQGCVPQPYVSHELHLGGQPHAAQSHLWLSPEYRLIADSADVDHFTYDGQGHALLLPRSLPLSEHLPLIVVGTGKTLQLKNVTVVNCISLPACLSLGPGARLLAQPEDAVTLLDTEREMDLDGGQESRKEPAPTTRREHAPLPDVPPSASSLTADVTSTSTIIYMDMYLEAVGACVEMVDAYQPKKGWRPRGAALDVVHQAAHAVGTKGSQQSEESRLRAVSLSVDLSASYRQRGADIWADTEVQSLSIQAKDVLRGSAAPGTAPKERVPNRGLSVSPGVSTILDPCQVKVDYQSRSTAPLGQDLKVVVGDVRLKLTPDVLQLLAHLQDQALAPLAVPAVNQPVQRCDTYERTWSSHDSSRQGPPFQTAGAGGVDVLGADKGVTIWRPKPPQGYVILGDVITGGTGQPSYQVMVMAVNSGFLTYPEGYTRVWSSGEVVVWRPLPQAEYVALGCVATTSDQPPSIKLVGCVHRLALVGACPAECMMLSSSGNLWGVENCAATFEVSPPDQHEPQVPLFELRSPLGLAPAMLDQESGVSVPTGGGFSAPLGTLNPSQVAYRRFCKSHEQLKLHTAQQQRTTTTVEFKKIWWDRNATHKSECGVSFWRPVPPPGYISLGDCLVVGMYASPRGVMVIRDSGPEDVYNTQPLLARPRAVKLVWMDEHKRGLGDPNYLCIYQIVAPPGYVSCGCVVGLGTDAPSLDKVRCVRADAAVLVMTSLSSPTWVHPGYRMRAPLNGYIVDELTSTFLVWSPGRSKVGEAPTKLEGYKFSASEKESGSTAKEGGQSPTRPLKVTAHINNVVMMLRNKLRTPLVELTAADVDATLFMQAPGVLHCSTLLRPSLWSYNVPLRAWEPVMEPWQVLIKWDHNTTRVTQYGVSPGQWLKICATDEVVHVTLAHAAINTILEALPEWTSVQEEGCSPQNVGNVDGFSVITDVENTLGEKAYLQLTYGDGHKEIVCLAPGATAAVRTPLPRPPASHSGQQAPILPPLHLQIDILGASGHQLPVGAQVVAVIRVGGAVSTQLKGISGGMSTRAVGPADVKVPKCEEGVEMCPKGPDQPKGQTLEWGERFLLGLPLSLVEQLIQPSPGDNPFRGEAMTLEITLVDTSGAGGRGVLLGTASLPVSFEWLQSQVDNLQSTSLPQQLRIGTRPDPQSEEATSGVEGKSSCTLSSPPPLTSLRVADGDEEWVLRSTLSLDLSQLDPSSHLKKGHRMHNMEGPQRAIRLEGSDTWSPFDLFWHTGRGAGGEDVIVIPTDPGMAMEVTYRAGGYHSVLRSLGQFVNSTDLPLEVCLYKENEEEAEWQILPSRGGTATTSGRVVEEEVFETERYVPVMGWSSNHLLPTDGKRYTRAGGTGGSGVFPKVALPPQWEWESVWEVEKEGNVDSDGWWYAFDVNQLRYPPPPGAGQKGPTDFVRRRRHVRCRRFVGADPQQVEKGTRTVLGVVLPSASLPLPYGWKREGTQLQVRPALDAESPNKDVSSEYSWSEGTCGGYHSLLLKELVDNRTRLVCCQAVGDGANRSVSLEASSPRSALLQSSTCWLSLCVQCMERPLGLGMDHLDDFIISARPPLVVYNRLPVDSHYAMWERSSVRGPLVMRQRGIMGGFGQVAVYTVDMRQQLNLTFSPDGYSYSESEPITISNGGIQRGAGVTAPPRLPSVFRVAYTHSQANTPLYIEVERMVDLSIRGSGIDPGTSEAPPTYGESDGSSGGLLDPGTAAIQGRPLGVKLCIPLWVTNATQLPLSLGVVTLITEDDTEGGPGNRTASMRRSQSGLVSGITDGVATSTTSMKVLDTEAFTQTQHPESICTVAPNSVEMLSYPRPATLQPGQQQAVAVVLSVSNSRWCAPIPLQIIPAGGQSSRRMQELQSEPLLIRAHSKSDQVLHEVVVRVEPSGLDQQVLVISVTPYLVLSNRTGYTLRVKQAESERKQLPSTGSSKSLTQPGAWFRDKDDSLMVLRPGAMGVPVSWSKSFSQRLLSVGLMSPGAGAQAVIDEQHGYCSEPFRVPNGAGWNVQVAVPLLPVTASGPRAQDEEAQEVVQVQEYFRRSFLPDKGPSLDVEDGAVLGSVRPRLVQVSRSSQYGLQRYWAVVVQVVSHVRPNGCLHLVLSTVGGEPGMMITNITRHLVEYQQPRVGGWLQATPFSAVGYCPGDSTGATGAEALIPAVVRFQGPDKRSSGAMLQDSSAQSASGRQAGGTAAGAYQIVPIPGAKDLGILQVLDVYESVMSLGGVCMVPGATTSNVGRTQLQQVLRVAVKPPVVSQGELRTTSYIAARDMATSAQALTSSIHLAVEITSLDISVVDSKPQELLLLSMDYLSVQYDIGDSVGVVHHQIAVRVSGAQLDDQLSGTPFPVIVCPLARDTSKIGPFLQILSVKEPGRYRGVVHFPVLAGRISDLRLAVSETVLWKMWDLFSTLKFSSDSRGGRAKHEVATADLPLQISLLNMESLPLRVSFRTNANARPPRYHGAQSLVEIAQHVINLDDTPLMLPGLEEENVRAPRSAIIDRIIRRLTRQWLSIIISVVWSSGVLGSMSKVFALVSSATASLAEGSTPTPRVVSASSSDVQGAGQGLMEGTMALAQGVLRGTRGLVTNPLDGAKKGGAAGFVGGMVRGVMGAAMNPISGVFEAASKVTEGVNRTYSNVRDNLQGTQVQRFDRRRLPRCIAADRVLRPYDAHSALGMALLEATINAALKSGAGMLSTAAVVTGQLGPMPRISMQELTDMQQDSYDRHFSLPNDRVLILTNARMIMVNASSFCAMEHEVLSGSDDQRPGSVPPGEIQWQLPWTQMLTAEGYSQQEGVIEGVFIHRKRRGVDNALRYSIRCRASTLQAQRLLQAIQEAKDRFYTQRQRDCEGYKVQPVLATEQMGDQQMPDSILALGYERLWAGARGGGDVLTIWRPQCPPGYLPLGDVATLGRDQPPVPARVYKATGLQQDAPEEGPRLIPPASYRLVFRDSGGRCPLTVWQPVAPRGYVDVGHVVVPAIEEPDPDRVACLRQDLVEPSQFYDCPLWQHQSSDDSFWYLSIYPVDNDASTFIAVNSRQRPDARLALRPSY